MDSAHRTLPRILANQDLPGENREGGLEKLTDLRFWETL